MADCTASLYLPSAPQAPPFPKSFPVSQHFSKNMLRCCIYPSPNHHFQLLITEGSRVCTQHVLTYFFPLVNLFSVRLIYGVPDNERKTDRGKKLLLLLCSTLPNHHEQVQKHGHLFKSGGWHRTQRSTTPSSRQTHSSQCCQILAL